MTQVWVDTDMGFDDLWALLLLRHLGVDPQGVSLVAGNVPLPQVIRNAHGAVRRLRVRVSAFCRCGSSVETCAGNGRAGSWANGDANARPLASRAPTPCPRHAPPCPPACPPPCRAGAGRVGCAPRPTAPVTFWPLAPSRTIAQLLAEAPDAAAADPSAGLDGRQCRAGQSLGARGIQCFGRSACGQDRGQRRPAIGGRRFDPLPDGHLWAR